MVLVTNGYGIPTVLVYQRFCYTNGFGFQNRFWYTDGFGIPTVSVFRTDFGIPTVLVYRRFRFSKPILVYRRLWYTIRTWYMSKGFIENVITMANVIFLMNKDTTAYIVFI